MAFLKICGLTRIADLQLCLRLGADYVGSILEIGRSPRALCREAAVMLLRCAQGKGVIVTESADAGLLAGLAQRCSPAAFQLHGAQSPEFVAELRARGAGAETWVVLAVPAEASAAEGVVDELVTRSREFAEAGAAKLVLDSRVKGASGGTGVPMNWELAAQVIAGSTVPVLLAGGITPGNALEALSVSRAAGLDASSGVETSPGVKAASLVRELLTAVKPA